MITSINQPINPIFNRSFYVRKVNVVKDLKNGRSNLFEMIMMNIKRKTRTMTKFERLKMFGTLNLLRNKPEGRYLRGREGSLSIKALEVQ